MKGRYEDQVVARRLRSEGHTIKEICSLVNASKSSVSAWVRDVEIDPKYLSRFENKRKEYKNIKSLEKGVAAWSKKCKDRRDVWREEGRQLARKNYADHAMLCSLYWAEGAKDKNCFSFANSDAGMMGLVVNLLKKYFNLSDDDFKGKIHFYENGDLKVGDFEKYWKNVLGVNLTWQKHLINPQNKNKVKEENRKNHVNKLPYGVCHLKVKCSTRIVQHIYGALEIYSGGKTVLDPMRRLSKK